MRKALSFVLVILLLTGIFPSSSTLISADPINMGSSDLKGKVNATYVRGDSWSVTANPDGSYTWRSEPLWIWDGSKFIPYIFKDCGDHYSVQTGLVGAKIYENKAAFFSPDLQNLAVGRENWLVYQWDGTKWVPVCASSQEYFEFSSYVESAEEINITSVWSTIKGSLKITYQFRGRLEHYVEWIPSQDGIYTIVQLWNDVVYGDIKLANGTLLKAQDAILSADSLSFLFHNDTQPFGILEDQYSARDMLYRVVFAKGSVKYQGIEITNGVGYIFYNSTKCNVLAGQKIVVDPASTTFDNPTEDGYVEFWSSVYYAERSTYSYCVIGYIDSNEYSHRGYVEWDISSIPTTIVVTDVDFLYHGKNNGDVSGIFAMAYQPTVRTAQQIYTDAGDGTQYVAYGTFVTYGTDREEDLGTTANTDLQSALSVDWFAIGFRGQSESGASDHYEEIYMEEYGSADPKPTLSVTYMVPPTNDACDSSPAFSDGVNGWVNVTVTDTDLVADLTTVDIQVNTTGDAETFTLRWTQATDAFSEVVDDDAVCTLSAGSTRVNIDTDTDKIAFKFAMAGAAGTEGLCDVKVTTTDDESLSDTDTYASEFAFGILALSYSFDDETGTTAEDASGLSNEGTITGATRTSDSKYGRGLSFDGNDYIAITSTNGFSASAGTLIMWYKGSDFSNAGTLFSMRTGPTNELRMAIGLNTMWIEVGAIQFKCDISNLTLDEWHLFMITWSSTFNETKFFIDRNLKDMGPYSTFTVKATAAIGRQDLDGTGYLTGEVDDVQIYSVVLDEDESSLVLYLPLNENTGTTAHDESGEGNDGTLTGGTAWADGKYLRALDFDGTDDYVQVSDDSSLDIIGDLTITAWIKMDVVNVRKSIVDKYWNNEFSFYYDGTTERLEFNQGTPWVQSYYSSVCDFQIGAWYFVGVTRVGTNALTFYYNGVAAGTAAPTSVPVAGSAGVEIGIDNAHTATMFFNGIIDEPRVYSRAFSSDDMEELYGSGLVLHLQLNEGSGTEAYDMSWDSNDGTITGALWVDGVYGDALDFDGTNDVIAFSHDYRMGTGSFSISVWVKGEAMAMYDFVMVEGGIDQESEAGKEGFALRLSSLLKPYFQVKDSDEGVALTGDNALVDGNWYFLVGVVDRTAQKLYLYVDGALQTSQPSIATVGSVSPTNPIFQLFTVGSYVTNPTYCPWDGLIDEPRIYEYALSQADVTELYSSLVLYDDFRNMPTTVEDPIHSFPYNLQTTISDMESGSYVYAESSYHFVGTYIRINTTYTIDLVKIRFSDGAHTTTLEYNTTEDEGDIDSDVVALLSASSSLTDNNFTVTWEVTLYEDIIDATNVDIEMYCYGLDGDDGWEERTLDYFSIYNIGGAMEYLFSGGSHIAGEHGFALTASTSGQWAAANMTVRKLQHVHMIFAWDTGSAATNASSHLDCPSDHQYTGSIEWGIYYLDPDDVWVKGWKVILDIDDGEVGTYGAGEDASWVEIRARWYKRTSLIKTDYFMTYHWGYDKDYFPAEDTVMRIQLDMWFNTENGSTIVAGRAAPYWYGMKETGTWWFGYGDFRPLIGNISSSMFYTTLEDNTGTKISATSLDRIKVHLNVTKNGCNDVWKTKYFEVFDYKSVYPVTSDMVGIQTPFEDFLQPGDPVVPATGLMGITSILSRLPQRIASAIAAAGSVGISVIDGVISALGGPSNMVSTYIDVIKTYFTYASSWLSSLSGMIVNIAVTAGHVLSWIGTFITRTLSAIAWLATNVLYLFVFPINFLYAFFTGTTFTIPFTDIDASFVTISPLIGAFMAVLPVFIYIAFLKWIIADGLFALPGKVRSIYDFSFGFFSSMFAIYFWIKGVLEELISLARSFWEWLT